MTASYWLIARHTVEFEQQGKSRADYGEELLARLAADLTTRCGRGFQVYNLQRMRLFYVAYPASQISVRHCLAFWMRMRRSRTKRSEFGTQRLPSLDEAGEFLRDARSLHLPSVL
jgi:hypothetical protein